MSFVDSYSVFSGSLWTLGHGPRSCLVLVKRSCGQVPTRKERHTFGSVMESCAALDEAPAPISCSVDR